MAHGCRVQAFRLSHACLQVPFIHWFSGMPRVQGVVANAAPVVTPYLFGRAGRQFFLGDELGEGETEALLVSPNLAPCQPVVTSRFSSARLH
jgi:hypothetical protein